MKDITRRDFIRRTVLGGGTIALLPHLLGCNDGEDLGSVGQHDDFLEGYIEPDLSFVHVSDQRHYSDLRYDTPNIRATGLIELFFRGTIEAIGAIGGGAFLISSGDNSIQSNMWTIRKYLGRDYPVYFAVGNHEVKDLGNMRDLITYNRTPGNLPNLVSWGPTGYSDTRLSFNEEDTSYSFDYGECHFAFINPWFHRDREHVTVPSVIFNWLERDLSNTDKKYIFVVGHEPAYPQPDMDTGATRHIGSSLDYTPESRDRFWDLLVEKHVLAYLCGHTHGFSTYQENGVWQIDSGNAVGPNVLQNYATFSKFQVYHGGVVVNTYRRKPISYKYLLRQTLDLVSGEILSPDTLVELAEAH